MAGYKYQYGTSPLKIEPEYDPRKKEVQKRKKISKEEIQIKQQELVHKKRIYHKNIATIVAVFLILLAISYRNSLITERFNYIQKQKNELSSVQKANGQLEVSIEGSLNLSNIEKVAKENLGMQKLQNSQKVYVSLPKQDYTEPIIQEITEQEEGNWFLELIKSIFN